MSDAEVGYCKPPKHTRFKKGVCPNPKGRGKRTNAPEASVVEEIMETKISYRENGREKKASRAEISVKRLIASALNGDVADAALLLKLRQQAARVDIGPLIVKISGGHPNGFNIDDAAANESK